LTYSAVDQNKDGQPKQYTVLRPDGTSVYITQDLGTAKMKFDEHKLDRSIYVVGSEQYYYFQSLFALLNMLGFEWASGCYHLSYGMVLLPEGKMKSREGTVVDADDLIEQMRQLAEQEIKRRDSAHELSIEEIQQRSLAIALGAIKFYLLRVRPEIEINFDPKESISFEGFTGPYCQYSYARSMSILRNAEDQEILSSQADFSLLGNEEERQLMRVLVQFPEELEGAARELSPARLCNHVFKVAQTFNQFYHKHSVLAAARPELAHARLVLVQAAAVVLRRGLMLLGIEALEQM
jgi:arginyl-tRNA synthetase